MPSTDEYCEAVDCYDYGRTEFCGYCADCWRQLGEPERELLLSRYIPDQKEQEVIERVRTVYPAKSVISTITLWTWRAWVTTVAAIQAWKWSHHG